MVEVLRSDLAVVDAVDRIAHRWGVLEELDPDFKRELIHHFSSIPVCMWCRKPKHSDEHYTSFEGVPHDYEPLTEIDPTKPNALYYDFGEGPAIEQDDPCAEFQDVPEDEDRPA